MELQDVYGEILELRKDLRKYHTQVILNRNDIVWLKRAVFGMIGILVTVVGSVVASALS